jgi:succinylglutamic semialdehyde dehydrogenase
MLSIENVLGFKPEFKGSFIKGQWSKKLRASGSFEVVSPANIDWVLEPVSYSFDDVQLAVEAAKTAERSWGRTPMESRIRVVRRFADELHKRHQAMARCLALETGKPLGEALAETDLLQTKIKVTIDESLKLIAAQDMNLGSQGRAQIVHRPKGVFVVIGPFNLGLSLPHGHLVPALLCGNVCIFKPSEKVPYSAQIYFEAVEAAGFPAGVLQMVQGQGEMGNRLVRDTDVDGVCATCTYDVGTKIQLECSEKPQKTTVLQMGAKNSAIVWKPTDLDLIADQIVKSAFMTSGQRCTALPKVFVERKSLEPLVKKVHDLAKLLIVTHPFETDATPFMGPLVSSSAKERFFRYVAIAESEGAEIVMRSKSLEGTPRLLRKPLPVGHYVTPSIHIVKGPDAKSPYQNHEIFGPDLAFCAIDSIDEGIAAVNDCNYGLAFSFFGSDEKTFLHVADEIEAGLVYWNRGTVGSLSRLPFGGWKKSGNNRSGGLFEVFSTTQVQTRIYGV